MLGNSARKSEWGLEKLAIVQSRIFVIMFAAFKPST